jgi:hypothetical protein
MESIKKWVLESHFGLGSGLKMTRSSDRRQVSSVRSARTSTRFFMLSSSWPIRPRRVKTYSKSGKVRSVTTAFRLKVGLELVSL